MTLSPRPAAVPRPFARRSATGCAVVAILLLPVPAAAWSDSTRERMSQDVARLLPTALAKQVARNQRAHLEGWRDAPAPGAADTAIETRVEAARQSLRKREGGKAFVRSLGAVCRVVADADDPLGGVSLAAVEMRTQGRAADFDRYAQSVRGRAPVVFAGWADGTALLADLPAFGTRVRDRAAADVDPLRRAYDADGRPDASKRFDDRSVPFAIASLSWSRAVSDCANVILAIWKSAGGDIAGTPWLDPKAAPRPPAKGSS